MELLVHGHGYADWGGRRLRCALGRSGIRRIKREGDGATPVAEFAVRCVLYRADRVPAPRTLLPVGVIAPDDGWCDAPGDPSYNQLVKLPYAGSAERLWREDALYDIVAATDYNAGPVLHGRGSAIFLHVARDDFQPTEGCIAFCPTVLRTILEEWDTGDIIRVAF